MADIYRQTGKIDEAITTFKKVRDDYSETQQAPNAAFFVGQLLLEKGDAKGSVAEYENFIKNHPDHELMPQAMFTLGSGQSTLTQNDAALATYKSVAEKYPESEVAPFAYFQRGSIVNNDGKQDEAVKIMQEFIEKYPNSGDTLFRLMISLRRCTPPREIPGRRPLPTLNSYRRTRRTRPLLRRCSRSLPSSTRRPISLGVTSH